ncbi:MAG: type II toxin-antitoxin system VapC family toxin [Hyphomicrobiales bacterium]
MTGWLLDTNVISEWRRPSPKRQVVAFVESLPREQIFTSSVCFAELRRGAQLTKHAESRRILNAWIDGVLRPYFGNQVLELTEDIILVALDLLDRAGRSRSGLSQVDAWIAATALHHGVVVVTRNVKDMVGTGARILNPWTGERCNGA